MPIAHSNIFLKIDNTLHTPTDHWNKNQHEQHKIPWKIAINNRTVQLLYNHYLFIMSSINSLAWDVKWMMRYINNLFLCMVFNLKRFFSIFVILLSKTHSNRICIWRICINELCHFKFIDFIISHQGDEQITLTNEFRCWKTISHSITHTHTYTYTTFIIYWRYFQDNIIIVVPHFVYIISQIQLHLLSLYCYIELGLIYLNESLVRIFNETVISI